jgi:uncharacterized protein (TIGR03067 family)
MILCAHLIFAGQGSENDMDLKALQGTWGVVSLEIDGKAVPADKAPKELKITGKMLTGIGSVEMTITIDATKKPKWLDMGLKIKDKEVSFLCIYDVENDELKICMPIRVAGKAFDNKRPENFQTAGKVVALYTAKRKTK